MKKTVAIILTAAMLLCAAVFAPLPSFGAGIERELDILDSDLWHSDTAVIDRRSVNGKIAISASPKDGVAGLVLSSSFDEISLTGCRELILTFTLRGDADEYNISTVLGSRGAVSMPYTVETQGQGTQKIYVPLSDTFERSLDSIEISVTSDSGALPAYLILTAVSADSNYTYSYRTLFGAVSVDCKVGSADESENGISLSPSQDGRITVSPKYIQDTASDGVYTVWLGLSGNAVGSIGVRAVNGDAELSVSSPQVLVSGRHIYSFIVDGAFTSIDFILENLGFQVGDSAGTINAFGGGVIYTAQSSRNDIGKVSMCKYENGKVTVTGYLNDEAAVEYVNADLGLYVLSADSIANNSLEGEPDVISGFSSRFSLSYSSESMEGYAGNMYQPVIVTDDEIVPIGYPVVAQCADTSGAAAKSFMPALDGADAYGVIEANTSASVVNIYISKLIETEDIYSSASYSYSGNVYYFDSGYMREMHRRLDFAAAAGIKVLVRILGDENASFDYDPYSADSIQLLCAACTFLAKEYPSVSGFIMGKSLNAQDMLSPDGGGVQCVADLASVFTASLKGAAAGGAEIYLPFSEDGALPPLAAYTAVRYAMAQRASPGVSMLYVCTNEQPEASAAGAMRAVSAASSFGFSADGCAEIWQPPADMTSDAVIGTYNSLCRYGGTQGMRFAALSVESVDKAEDFYTALRNTLMGENSFSASVEDKKAYVKKDDSAGSYELWNFEGSYDTGGWLSGGSFGDAVTDLAELRDGRALKASSTGYGAGMMVCSFPEPINMSDTEVAVRLGVSSNRPGGTKITVILGANDAKTEFSATVEYNKPVELFCKMGSSASAAAVEYAAVVVSDAFDTTLEMYNVRLCSNTLNDDEMNASYETPSFVTDPLLYAAVILVAAATVVVFSLLARKKYKRHR